MTRALSMNSTPKILLPPGSGDCHWVFLKMESIIKSKLQGRKPEIWVWSQVKSRDRSEDYIRRIPFVKWGGYFPAHQHSGYGREVFGNGNPCVSNDWQGFDLFISFNAPLNRGEPIDSIMPECWLNWDYEINLTSDDLLFGLKTKAKYGHYVPVCFYNGGCYGQWNKYIEIEPLLEGLLENGYTPVLTGREWDEPFMEKFMKPGYVNLIGKTSMGQLLGLLRHASGFIGHAAGNGMLAQHLNCKTFMYWLPEQWTPAFMTNWVDPCRIKEGIYHPLNVKVGNSLDYILEKL